MNAIQNIIQDQINIAYARAWEYTKHSTDWNEFMNQAEILEEIYDKIKELPLFVSEEDINKLQRYDDRWECGVYESKDWEYVRYDSLISLLTK